MSPNSSRCRYSFSSGSSRKPPIVVVHRAQPHRQLVVRTERHVRVGDAGFLVRVQVVRPVEHRDDVREPVDVEPDQLFLAPHLAVVAREPARPFTRAEPILDHPREVPRLQAPAPTAPADRAGTQPPAITPLGRRPFHHVQERAGAHGRLDVVHAHHRDTLFEAPHRRGQRCFVALVDRQAAEQRAEERLARRADDERRAGDAASSGSARNSARLCSRVLPNPIPGSTRTPARARRRRSRPRRDARRYVTDLAYDVDVRRIAVASCAACPACASRRSRPRARRRPAACDASAVPPDTSLTIVAPASSAAARDRGLRGVDADRTPRRRRRARAPPGRTRRTSSSASTGSAPGRVDSPPTSSTAAPAASQRSSVGDRRVGSRKLPPSEKESGVTFTTPMTARRGNDAQ